MWILGSKTLIGQRGSLILVSNENVVFLPMKENGLQFDISFTKYGLLKVEYLMKIILCPGRRAWFWCLGVGCVGEQ